MKSINIKSDSKDILKAMGIVFGDIGTSPIYTLAIIFTLTKPTYANIIGILSLVFWTLILLVTIQYAWLAMSLSIKGEGGVLVLKEVLVSLLKKGRKVGFISFIGYIGVSLLLGDGVITPAISILSAVEGLKLIPGLEHLHIEQIMLMTIIITIILFSIQSKGTGKVAISFGPIIISGLYFLVQKPEIIQAINPLYAINFFIDQGLPAFFILSEVILCATGGEALYADMGHLGSKPIRQAWIFVFIALVVNYFGQGAYLLDHPDSSHVLFRLVKDISELFYIPFLVLTLFATIIASQAMISAVMSLVYQGINIGIFPLMKIKYTSTTIRSQIYITTVNWLLLAAVIMMILFFRESANLAAAYGLAVTATMTISSIFILTIFKHLKKYYKVIVSVVIIFVNVIFLAAVTTKIPYGGYWSIVIAIFCISVIGLWISGMKRVKKALRSVTTETFIESYNQVYSLKEYIKGEAVFFTKHVESVSPYILHCMFRTGIMYEKNILVSVESMDNPYGIELESIKELAPGLFGAIIRIGYMEIPDLPALFKKWGFNEKVIFYGVEEISARRLWMKAFVILKKLSSNWVSFYRFPYNKLHGVVTRIEI